MERLNTRIFSIAVLVMAMGAVIHLAPKPAEVTMTEEELIEMVPDTVMGVRYTRGPEPGMTYRMGQQSYDLLKPFGIVSRVFEVGDDKYDAVVIASRSKDSFHDPRVCFSGQGWNIERFDPVTIKTQTRGEVPAMLIQTFSESTRRQLAAFLYKGPGGFYGSTQSLKFAFLGEQLRLGNNLDGVFYRFIPKFKDEKLSEQEQKERLTKFMAAFLDEANKSSNGYL